MNQVQILLLSMLVCQLTYAANVNRTMEMGSPIRFEESGDESDKWSKIQMGIQSGKNKKKNRTMVTMTSEATTPLAIITVLSSTTLKQEVSTASPVELNEINSVNPVTSSRPMQATVQPIKQVEYHEFIEELDSTFAGETTTNALDDRFLINAPSICPIGTQRDSQDKCRKVYK